jgi:hypothetical protein
MTGTAVRVAAALTIGLLTSSFGWAQTTRTEQIEKEKADKAAKTRPQIREKGDIIITKIEHILAPEPPAVKVSFGGVRPGASLAPGVAYVTPVGGRALWTTSAVWSIKNFKAAASTVEWPKLARSRVDVRAFGRWEDAPELTYFGLGAQTQTANNVRYGLRSSEAGIAAELYAARWLRFGGGVRYFHVTSGDGSGLSPAIGNVFTAADTPGLNSRPTWLHSTAFAAIDWREARAYTQRGGLYQLTFHDYADRHSQYGFRSTEIDLRQLVPVLNGNWIIAVQGRADLTSAANGQVIPYFMLPYLGGGQSLRGFDEYRFTDRNTLALRAELRWTPSSVLDMAVFTDHGTVAPRWQDLHVRDMKNGWGFGARFHGPTFMVLRLEVGQSGEGWHYHVSQGASF